MSILKSLCKLFKCQSNCSFNNELFDLEIHGTNLSDFKLKHKDLDKIHRILSKRERHSKDGKIIKTNQLSEI